MVVSHPIVDVRQQPHTTAQPDVHDPLQETQLLYGELVKVLDTQDGWAHIEALEQAEYSKHRRWQGYPGWIPENILVPEETTWSPTIVVTAKWAQVWLDAYKTKQAAFRLPMGTMLRGTGFGGVLWKAELVEGETVWLSADDAEELIDVVTLSEQEKRQHILRTAEKFIGDPYSWGGRSPHWDQASQENAISEGSDIKMPTVTGVDCSGLVNLSFRTVGIPIPRDAHEQFLRAHPIKALQPADLIFLSEANNPRKIVHVMLYAGAGMIIEGPGTGLAVRRITLSERLGQPLDWLAPGSVVDDQTLSFGTYFP